MPQNGVRGGADQRLSASERIRLGPEFERVYEQGQPHRTSLLVLFVLRAAGLERKAGFVAGRRVGGAVARNRAKRLMREAYRRNKERVPATGVHLVVVARAGCGEAAYADVESAFLKLLERAGLAGNAAGGADRNASDDEAPPLRTNGDSKIS